ncbi:MAG: hypothetical protein DRQ88_08100 [Epsilonproteobacteria bacterium]|nr:MAG: hypothetical protein DRQ89_09120 [Campylobacterota bacterium]RLA66014.1 MAG: hypothetical protein DRQ88_08100 [Campylobacterota bacterium]
MKNLFLILPLAALLFATQGWAPPPGKGGAPSKINMPKDQPGYSAFEDYLDLGSGNQKPVKMTPKGRKSSCFIRCSGKTRNGARWTNQCGNGGCKTCLPALCNERHCQAGCASALK